MIDVETLGAILAENFKSALYWQGQAETLIEAGREPLEAWRSVRSQSRGIIYVVEDIALRCGLDPKSFEPLEQDEPLCRSRSCKPYLNLSADRQASGDTYRFKL